MFCNLSTMMDDIGLLLDQKADRRLNEGKLLNFFPTSY